MGLYSRSPIRFSCLSQYETCGNAATQSRLQRLLKHASLEIHRRVSVFNVNGVPNTAMFYFKNIKGEIIDRFDVMSNVHMNAADAQR
jgi:hypothetical protein